MDKDLPDVARAPAGGSVLWLSNETPDRDGQGGQRRQYFQIRALVRAGWSVHVLTLAGDQDDTTLREIATVERFAPFLHKRLPHPTRYFLARRRARSGRYDHVIVAHLESWALLRGAGRRLGVPILVDVHNVMSPWLSRYGRTREAATFRRIEDRVLRDASAVSVCSPAELDRLPDGGTARRIVAPHGIDESEWPPPPAAVPGPVVGMFGNWSWTPNTAGIAWFAKDVWPRVREAVPDAEWHVAGSGTPARFAEIEGFRGLGRVPALTDLTAVSRVVGVPVRAGVGAPVKFGEALATGRPVIATTDGASAHPGSPARVTNDTDEWVAWLVERLGPDPALADDEGRRTYRWAMDQLPWERTTAPIVAWLSENSTRSRA
ncbi:glycosyltransferase family 4 protein [Oerskovia sp. Root22]|uniref:glycosyltransferase family 4 protein n=1 Tax=Oerskovia sp. Root22 TaxID=1736494 RepID=UPI000A66A7B3|nr:glycosyltransferase family 4 protein [Oerskovia sp. Root22]